MSKPELLTYATFLHYVDEARRKFSRVECAFVNRRNLMSLLIELKGMINVDQTGACRIMGIEMEVDGRVPDNAVKIGNVIYQKESEKCLMKINITI